VLGKLGSGFQNRFILPIIPATSILFAISSSFLKECSKSKNLKKYPVLAALVEISQFMFDILLPYSSVLCLFYGIMFSPLFADLNANLFDIIATILSNSYHSFTSVESFTETYKFLLHFGINTQRV
jgi:hypothetical protein